MIQQFKKTEAKQVYNNIRSQIKSHKYLMRLIIRIKEFIKLLIISFNKLYCQSFMNPNFMNEILLINSGTIIII